jgi:choice-of-anchor A domain-containing protein
MNHKILYIAMVGWAASGLRSQADNISTTLSEWNLITAGNLQDVTDVNGNTYVGGNVTVANSFDVGTSDSATVQPGNYSLAVDGNINSGGTIDVDAGNTVVGGTVTGRTISGGTVTKGSLASVPSSPVSTVDSASTAWSKMTANSSAAVSGGTLNFNCANSATLAVFNITAATLFKQNQSFGLKLGSSTAQVVINVSGTSATEAGGENFNGLFSSWGNRVVFNFYQATSVSLSGSIYGYVVAPDATVSTTSTIVGGVMANVLNSSSEVERCAGTSDYANTPAVPDAGNTAGLLGLSFSSLALVRRRYFGRAA